MYSVGLSEAAHRPPASRASNGSRILLIQRRWDFDFAALLGGVLTAGLLVIQLAFDDLLHVRPRIGADQAAAVQKGGGGAINPQRSSFRNRGVYFGFGRSEEHTSELQSRE